MVVKYKLAVGETQKWYMYQVLYYWISYLWTGRVVGIQYWHKQHTVYIFQKRFSYFGNICIRYVYLMYVDIL